ncbi:MAG TPA: hypothetical protein PLV42_02115 [bacterium]|nr:hypothetical protein [bacterium]
MTDQTTLRLEYKKFNTFLFDYIRSLSRGWIFMKMKHRYPLGADLNFVITSAAIDRSFTIPGTVVYHGVNEEGKEGVGIRLRWEGVQADDLRRTIAQTACLLFGERLAGRIMMIAEEHGDGI